MKEVYAVQMTEKEINEIGLYLAEFTLEFIPGRDDANAYDANDFLSLFDKCYANFIRYAETNRMINQDVRRILIENEDGLDSLIKDVAIDAAREIIINSGLH